MEPRFQRADTRGNNLKEVLRMKDGPDEYIGSIEHMTLQKGIHYTEPNKFCVKVWGEAFNVGADPSIEKDLGIKAGSYYFTDKNKKDEFINMISQQKYMNQGIMIQCKGYYKDEKI